MVYEAIRELVRYGLEKGLITEDDAIYARNQILEVLKMDEYEEPEKDGELTGAALEKILKVLLDYAAEKGLLQENSVVYRDLFDTKLMNCLMPRPSEVTKTFWEKYQVSPETATDYYYNLSRNSDYIRRYRVSKDMKWTTDTVHWISQSTYPNRKKIQRLLQQRNWQSRAVIQSVSFVWKISVMQAE